LGLPAPGVRQQPHAPTLHDHAGLVLLDRGAVADLEDHDHEHEGHEHRQHDRHAALAAADGPWAEDNGAARGGGMHGRTWTAPGRGRVPGLWNAVFITPRSPP